MEKALHRFHEEMTENLQLAAELMLEKYNGDPREIWQDQEEYRKKLRKDLKNFKV